MKFRIYRTSGNEVKGPMITEETRKLRKPFPYDLEGISEMNFRYCDVPDLEHLLKLPLIFWDNRYNKPAELILTTDSWTGEPAIEIYDDWRE